MTRKLITRADPIMLRTRQMYATLKRRSGGKFLLSLAEFRNNFGTFYYRPLCPYCQQVLALGDISVDHKLPVSRGGRSYADNLQFICKSDNTSKGDMSHEEYTALLKSLDALEVGLHNFTLKSKVLTALRISASFQFGANRRARKS